MKPERVLKALLVFLVVTPLVPGSAHTQQVPGNLPDSPPTFQVDVLGRLPAGSNRVDYSLEPLTADITGKWDTEETTYFRDRDKSKDATFTAGCGGGGTFGDGPGRDSRFLVQGLPVPFGPSSELRTVAFEFKYDKSAKLTGEVLVLGTVSWVASAPVETGYKRAFAPQVFGRCAQMSGVRELESKLPMYNLVFRGRTVTFNTQQTQFQRRIDMRWQGTVVYHDLIVVTRQGPSGEDVLRFHRPEAVDPVKVNGTVTFETGVPRQQVVWTFTNRTPDRVIPELLNGRATTNQILQLSGRASRNKPAVKPIVPITVVAKDSKITAELPASEYRVTVEGLPAGYVVKSLTADSVDLLKEPLRIDVVPKRSKPKIQMTVGKK